MANAPVKTKMALFKLTIDQHRELKQRAEHCKLSMASWMRSILLQAASQKPRKGYLRIREPDGATS
jgi:hypothetical protein